MTVGWEDEVVAGDAGRFPVSVMGVPIGTAASWDEMEHLAEYYEAFIPLPGINLTAGDLGVDYEYGLFQNYNEVGEITSTVRIYDILKDVLG